MKVIWYWAVLLFSVMTYADLKVGMVFDKGGKDDKSFNTAAYQGLKRAEVELKIKSKYVEGTDDSSYEGLLRQFAQRDYDLIIAIGFGQGDAVKKVSATFPNKKFVVVDAEVNAPNVSSVMFEEHEGSFLAGAVAALLSKSQNIGFIGGMDIPLIRRFEKGYIAGVNHILPRAKVQVNYVGITGEAWNNPPKGKELALAQYNKGVDIIFSAAGATNLGVFDAAEEKKKYAIGVDSNQNWIKPGLIVTSMLKRVDNAVFDSIQSMKSGSFKSGVQRMGLANNGIDLAVDKNNQIFFDEKLNSKMKSIKEQILSGKIKVPDYYKMKK